MTAEVLLTALGDAFVASAVALVVMLWIWVRLGWLLSMVFGVYFAAVWLIVVGLKLITRDMAKPVADSGLLQLSQGAPSGHVALAAAAFGGAALIFLMLDRRPIGFAGAALSLGAVGAVGVTRITLHTHTIADVLAGLALAALGLLVFGGALNMQTRARPAATGGLLLAISAAALLALMSGVRVDSNDFL